MAVSNVTDLNVYNLSDYQRSVGDKTLDFKAKAAFFENEYNIRIDENTPFILSKDSKVQLGFQGEFMRVYFNSTGSHAELVENTARKYAELREGILEGYKDDEDEMYKKLGELNQAFETALNNTCPMLTYSPEVNTEIRVSYNQADRIRNERELEKTTQAYARCNKAMKDIMSNLQNSMLKHMDTFYESFIEAVQVKDFDTAFAESMALLQNSETKSVNEISYNDVLNIRGILANEAVKFDNDGRPTEYRYETSEDAFRALVRDNSIPYIVRKDVAQRFGF